MTPATGSPSSPRGVLAVVVAVVALVLALVAAALVGLGAYGLVSTATPNMRGFNPGATVTVTESGLSVYARSDEDRSSTVCRAAGEDTTVLDRPTGEFVVEVAGSDFYEIARGPDELSAGSYVLTCDGTNASVYVGPRAPSTSAAGLIGIGGLIGGLVLGFFAVLLGIVALLVRPRRDRRSGPAGPRPSWGRSGAPSTEALPDGHSHDPQVFTSSEHPEGPESDQTQPMTRPDDSAHHRSEYPRGKELPPPR